MVTFVVDEGRIGCEVVPVWAFPGFPPPRPATAQPTSIPDLIDQSQTNPKTGALTKTFKTGKRSGYRAGGWMTSSKRCRTMHTVETICVHNGLDDQKIGGWQRARQVTHQGNKLAKGLWTLEGCVSQGSVPQKCQGDIINLQPIPF